MEIWVNFGSICVIFGTNDFANVYDIWKSLYSEVIISFPAPKTVIMAIWNTRSHFRMHYVLQVPIGALQLYLWYMTLFQDKKNAYPIAEKMGNLFWMFKTPVWVRLSRYLDWFRCLKNSTRLNSILLFEQPW